MKITRSPSFSTVAPLVLTTAVAAFGSSPLRAEYYGLKNGRSADLSRMPDRSIEGGAVFGDLYDADYQHFGVRFNGRLSPELMLYGDIGQSEIEDADGIAFGIGGYYQVDGVFTGSDFAIKGSYHQLDAEDGDFEAELTALSFEALVSGREGVGARGNITWYASIGIHKLDFDDAIDDETEIGFGGGFVMPNAAATGEFYAGLDLIDEMTFGAGYRHFLK